MILAEADNFLKYLTEQITLYCTNERNFGAALVLVDNMRWAKPTGTGELPHG
jgi:hypothetical protein